MTYFDESIAGAPVAERNTDPILPEERFIFELVGFERSEPDQWHKNGGIKWTFATYDTDGRPWEFQDEHYMLWRTTNVNKAGEPLFTIGTQAHEWAQALLGRKLGPDDHFNIAELRNKRMSSQIVWEPKRTKPTEKSAVLRSLRHVPVSPVGSATATRPAPGQVSADPTDDEVERATIVTDMEKAVKRLKKLDAEAGAAAAQAFAESDLEDAPLDDLRQLLKSFQDAVVKAMDD
jgi:GH43 family beta-xylosidase